MVALNEMPAETVSDVVEVGEHWAKGDSGDVLQTDAMRITHTWIRTNGTWKILGGMSAPVNEKGQ